MHLQIFPPANWQVVTIPAAVLASCVYRLCVSCRVGVTSQPECTVIELTPADKFIVLASDGVWEFIESQEAIEIIGACETVEEGCRQVKQVAAVS